MTNKPEELAKGERMPQTPEQFALMADKYEKALLREKEENSRLRAKLNELNQKYSKAKREQQAKHIEIIREQLTDRPCLADDLILAINEHYKG